MSDSDTIIAANSSSAAPKTQLVHQDGADNVAKSNSGDTDDSGNAATWQTAFATLPPPPDGGFRAWAQVLVAHLGSFNGWGYMTSFGLFQSYYTDTLLPGTAASSISWIGSLQIFLAFAIGSVSGRALDAGYLRQCVIVGSALQVLAIMMASMSQTYWQLLLTQGLCKGIGDGLIFCPTVANVPTYFSRTAAGGPWRWVSRLSGPRPVRLMPSIGYGWTVRVMGFIVLFNAAVMLALVKSRFDRSAKTSDDAEAGAEHGRLRRVKERFSGFFEWSAFHEPPYALFCAGMFSVWLALYFAFYYVSQYGKTYIGVDTSTSLTLLLAMNAVGAPSRVLFGLLSDKLLGPIRALILGVLCTGVMFYSWIAVADLTALFVFCCLYGSFAAGVQALFPATCAGLTRDVRRIGSRTGMAFAVVSVATLTGPPLGGALVQAREAQGGGYLYAQIFGGSVLLVGAGLLVLSGWRRQKEARGRAGEN
ncbi:major facilitator superfamily domain-containing protein [Microdochium trichocladiopsis]|uniref:Major facilitator superfamily domain-containing protein n=1 Tax=Microdochium trichocladiopsis TaxID=1682393 RepID=A0A9P8Y3W2_9PEZI|nr:major facilitator superfamily domain-containing protein [Microdochium trichocladiopsis]KAH7026707.1 major facilitator superfamily domain-containing protein [Microdochium trichocladiopsis]